MNRRHLLLLLFAFISFHPTIIAQSDPCAGVIVVAQATGGVMTCDDPTVNLTGAQHPSALSFSWSGPNGFSSNKRVAQTVRQGLYTLTVTGQNGCTATATAVVTDICTTPNSAIVPRQCDDTNYPYPEPNEYCEAACVFKCLGEQYFGSTRFWEDGFKPPAYCGSVENDQWMAFMPLFQNLTFIATPINCDYGDGLQISIYENCYAPPLVCNMGQDGGGNIPVSVTVGNLIPGKGYYLMIDGYSGDQCDFVLEALHPGVLDMLCQIDTSSGCPPGVDCTVWDTIQVVGPDTLCPGGIAKFILNKPPGAVISGYQWTGPEGTLIDGQPVPVITYPPYGNKVNIQIGNQPGTICVRTLTYFFPPSPPLCIDVGLGGPLETQLPDTTICYEDAPFITPTGDEIWNTGSYVWILQAESQCDSIIRQKVIIRQPVIKDLKIYGCDGECVDVSGTTYCIPGIYEETQSYPSACDTTFRITYVQFSPFASISAAVNTLTCQQPAIGMSAAYSSNPSGGPTIRNWKHLESGVQSSAQFFVATEPGTYVFTVTHATPATITPQVECSFSDTIVIYSAGLPSVNISYTPFNACINPVSTLTAQSDTPGATFKWSGPGGFSATGSVQMISTAGMYTVTVTDPATGCTAKSSIVLESNVVFPTVTAIDDTLTCLHIIPDLEAITDASNPQFEWELLPSGVYQVTVTDGVTGCTATDMMEVVLNTNVPDLTASADAFDCLAQAFYLHASSSTSGVTFNWIGPGGFQSIIPSPEITQPGQYTVIATNPANGCTTSEKVSAIDNRVQPDLQIFQAPPGCGDSLIQITAASNSAGAHIFWTSANGVMYESDSLSVPYAPVYLAHAVGDNGCERLISLFPAEPPAFSVVTMRADTLTCDMPTILIEITATGGQNMYLGTGPGGVVFNAFEPLVGVEGWYYLTVITQEGCVTKDSVWVEDICVTGTNFPETDLQISLYPVPSDGQVWLKLGAGWQYKNLQIELFDAAGLLIQQFPVSQAHETETLHLEQWPAGAYTLRVRQSDQIWTGQLILIR